MLTNKMTNKIITKRVVTQSLFGFLISCAFSQSHATAAQVSAAPPASVPAVAAPFATPKTGKVFFISPKDGESVSETFKAKFGVTDIKVRPAGEDPSDHSSGHHHVIVDGKATPMGMVVPADEKNIHFGKGQTEVELKLPAGPHTLTLQFADGAHRSYGEAFSQTIHVTVAQGKNGK